MKLNNKIGELVIEFNWNDELIFQVNKEHVSFESLGTDFEQLSIGVRNSIAESLGKFSFNEYEKESMKGSLFVNVRHLDMWLIKSQQNNVPLCKIGIVFEELSLAMQRALDQIRQGKTSELNINVIGVRDKNNDQDGKKIDLKDPRYKNLGDNFNE